MKTILEIAVGVWAASFIPVAVLGGIAAALWLLRKAYHIGIDVYLIICKMLGK